MTADELVEELANVLERSDWEPMLQSCHGSVVALLKRLDALGYCIMPKEATDEMRGAAMRDWDERIRAGKTSWWEMMGSNHAAMIQAGSIKLEKAG